MIAVEHPRLAPGEYACLQANAGWSLPLELIRGVPVVVPPATALTSWANGELFLAVRRWQQRVGDSGLALQHVFVRFGEEDWLAPTIAWWSAARRPEPQPGPVEHAPDLVVEVMSSRTRPNAEGPKREAYTAAAVRELWLVDPERQRITFVQPGRDDQTFDRDHEARSVLLHGLAVTPATIVPE